MYHLHDNNFLNKKPKFNNIEHNHKKSCVQKNNKTTEYQTRFSFFKKTKQVNTRMLTNVCLNLITVFTFICCTVFKIQYKYVRLQITIKQ